MEPIIATNLFRIIQEGVNNAIKYAEADCLKVSLLAENNNLKVTIKDDGKGYDLMTKPNGYGLKNINSRIKTLNGICETDTGLGKGTKISFQIPI